MPEPITIEIPHTLGRSQARTRIENGIGQFTGIIPGSVVSERHWEGDTLTFRVDALGQSVTTQVAVFDDLVRATMVLPPMLAMIAGKLRAKLAETGAKLLR